MDAKGVRRRMRMNGKRIKSTILFFIFWFIKLNPSFFPSILLSLILFFVCVKQDDEEGVKRIFGMVSLWLLC